MTKLTRIVIIGNGIAGVTACRTIRQINPSIPLAIISDENTVAYSAPVLAYYLGGDIPRPRVFIRKPEDYSDIETHFGEKVTGLDFQARKIFTDRGVVDFDFLVLATGASPSMPAITGLGLKGVFTFKTLADIDAIASQQPKKAVVAGAGPVGIEAAVALKKMGAEVALVATRWILPRVFDDRAAGIIQKALERNGVKVVNHERVQSIEGEGRVSGVKTGNRSVECDTVVMAAGMKAEVHLAARSGVKLGETGGIAVDDAMATSIEGVFACGDCIESSDAISGKKALNMLWSNARQQGRVAGASCLGIKHRSGSSINVRALNVFGIAASAFGYSVSALDGKNVEVTEKETLTGYYRLVYQGGKLVGGQWVGAIRDTGGVMAAARCHDRLVLRVGMHACENPMWRIVSKYQV